MVRFRAPESVDVHVNDVEQLVDVGVRDVGGYGAGEGAIVEATNVSKLKGLLLVDPDFIEVSL